MKTAAAVETGKFKKVTVLQGKVKSLYWYNYRVIFRITARDKIILFYLFLIVCLLVISENLNNLK